MKKLIADIKSRLAGVTGIKYIDEDWGQLDYYSPDFPVKYPCVLIDLAQVPWSNQGKLIQMGLVSVSIRVANMKLSNTNVKAPASQQAAAASIFDLLTSIHQALHGWTADSMNGPLTRTLTRKVNRDDGIREFEMIYSVQIIDDSAKPGTIEYPMTEQKIKLVVERIKMPAQGAPAPPEPDYRGTEDPHPVPPPSEDPPPEDLPQ
jgi:hypothetical protein